MSAHEESNAPVITQPTLNVVVTPPTQVEPTHGGWRDALSTCWHAIMPCMQVALSVGSEAARAAIDARLANNTDLTAAQKARGTSNNSRFLEIFSIFLAYPRLFGKIAAKTALSCKFL